MQSLIGPVRSARARYFASSKIPDLSSAGIGLGSGGSGNGGLRLGFPAPDCGRAINASGCSFLRIFASSLYSLAAKRTGQAFDNQLSLVSLLSKDAGEGVLRSASSLLSPTQRSMSTVSTDASDPAVPVSPRIKFKRLDKTARNIMQILDREAVVEVKSQRETPEIRPGYIIQMKVESPENKRRVTTIKGIVIARRNAGLNTTFRLRRLVAGVGVESLFPLYSPNIKEVKVLDKKKVRRAKLYYLRERMNPLKK